MATWLLVAAPLMLLYGVFHFWYGGRGKPMSPAEVEGFMQKISSRLAGDHSRTALEELRQLAASDDGQEFVMQNLVRYRAKALYPPGYDLGDDPRAADRRYAKAIFWPLLRNGNIVVFVARRSGSFIESEGAEAWHYVAMVRYRSRRDFLRFALQSSDANIFVHKWAAIEKTHVFPVKPLA
ncbi:MAG: hypothetical protein K2X78_12595, partial [Burkholderiaceae bacterium]|nr:hypothetical protein [Burkholderiaceae bacterium]